MATVLNQLIGQRSARRKPIGGIGLTPAQMTPHMAANHIASTGGSGYGTDPSRVSADRRDRQERRAKDAALRDKYGAGAWERRLARQVWAGRHGVDADVRTWDQDTVDLARKRGLLPGGHAPRARTEDFLARLLGAADWPPDLRHHVQPGASPHANYGGRGQGGPIIEDAAAPRMSGSAIEQALMAAASGSGGRQSVTLPNDAVTVQQGRRRRHRSLSSMLNY
jgi:hypothetical protein